MIQWSSFITNTVYNELFYKKQLITVCDKYSLSNGYAAGIASRVLTDFGLISTENLTLVIDKIKIHRVVSKVRKENSKEV